MSVIMTEADLLGAELTQRINEVAGYDFNIKKYKLAISILEKQPHTDDHETLINQLSGLIKSETTQRLTAETMRLTVLELLNDHENTRRSP